LSRRERPADDRGQIESLRKAGRFVVYLSYERYCRFTDASLGEDQIYIDDFATLAEAEEAVSECEEYQRDEYYIATPRVPPSVPKTPSNDVDIPF